MNTETIALVIAALAFSTAVVWGELEAAEARQRCHQEHGPELVAFRNTCARHGGNISQCYRSALEVYCER